MAPVKVFGSAAFTNVARVLVCLEEVGADYEVVDIDFAAKEHKNPEHLARNPFGEIPAFQDGDLVLFESRAIAKYILRKYRTDEADMLRESDPEEAATVDVWAEVEAHQYSKAVAPIVYECIVYPTAYGVKMDQKVVDESMEKLKKVLEIYEGRLSKHEYLAGSFISVADLNHFPFTLRFMETPYASVFDSFPCVKAWWEKLMLRPSMKKLGADMQKRV
ncbi:putative glutathione S-transferase GSTF1 [Hordeum vulgare]|nr:putative glutathione S-transferase GSTF1 [Hordeum vulgare]